jgi:hypothetical protein
MEKKLRQQASKRRCFWWEDFHLSLLAETIVLSAFDPGVDRFDLQLARNDVVDDPANLILQILPHYKLDDTRVLSLYSFHALLARSGSSKRITGSSSTIYCILQHVRS